MTPGPMTSEEDTTTGDTSIGNTTARTDRVQLGVRLERNLVKVLKGLAEFNDETLGELLERIVLHSFEPVPGDEGESCASPHSRKQLQAVAALREVYAVSDDVHAARGFTPDPR